ncbi:MULTISPECIES: hypothetical protein [Acinetobacter]|jgi:hypothetical protein|uniref:Uncharacterized protein n=1 Tax=Acinetobacter vivianii TaxID=1776742 RepID=N8WAZ1_9GAMM|nr:MULTISPECIES: hypothetical protein [Acinetobacter]ENU92492.1 hypothetical protein F971_02383 [Acinetobacter vivianii]KHF77648.1 hypothetical protein PJ15_0703 [Acinetobacter sp. neg1]MBJ8481775.1 hypothetical protein [Acinetobacter vivianii]MEB6478650.1 hypothetical protein [Acinetobacter vivianii]MEB6657519.1 hypothetical protein [Acinetobacter vivianii]
MHQYLKIAEQIYEQVQSKHGFTDDHVEDLNNLMIELRSVVKKSNFKMLYNYINFEDLLMKSKALSINLDVSILPKSKNKGEYILWLSGFVEKLIVSTKKSESKLKNKVVIPSYYYDELGNIVDKSKNSGEEIVSYFKHKEPI